MRTVRFLVVLAVGSASSGCQGRTASLTDTLDASAADDAVTRPRGGPLPGQDAGPEGSQVEDASAPAVPEPAGESPDCGGVDAGGWQDAFADFVAPDGAACHGAVIRAHDYDRSCATDSDCVEVSEGNACGAGCACGGMAINRCALPRYQADLQASGVRFVGTCNCPADFGACCRAGLCVDTVCCLNPCPDGGDR